MRSPVFAARFQIEKDLAQVDIPDVSGAALEAFMAYLYSGDVEGVARFSTELAHLAEQVCCCSLPKCFTRFVIYHIFFPLNF